MRYLQAGKRGRHFARQLRGTRVVQRCVENNRFAEDEPLGLQASWHDERVRPQPKHALSDNAQRDYLKVATAMPCRHRPAVEDFVAHRRLIVQLELQRFEWRAPVSGVSLVNQKKGLRLRQCGLYLA